MQRLLCWLTLILQIPLAWKPVLEDSSTLQIYFDYYALTKPPISKEVSLLLNFSICMLYYSDGFLIFSFFCFCCSIIWFGWIQKITSQRQLSVIFIGLSCPWPERFYFSYISMQMLGICQFTYNFWTYISIFIIFNYDLNYAFYL